MAAPLAILGGTFDPVHYGHLRLANEVRAALQLSEVRMIPAGDPPHRAAPHARAADRVAMLHIAVNEFPGLVVDTREIDRDGKSYTFDTLTQLHEEDSQRPLALLVGADAFRGLPTWHRWRELFGLAHVVVVPRPGVALDTNLPPQLQSEWQVRRVFDTSLLHSRVAGTIYVQPVTAQPISSTEVRAALARGDGAKIVAAGLLPAAVLAYIESRQLYRHLPHGF